jgi:hypothetical protein
LLRFGFLTVANPGHSLLLPIFYRRRFRWARWVSARNATDALQVSSEGVALASEWAGIAVEAASANPADRASITSVATGHRPVKQRIHAGRSCEKAVKMRVFSRTAGAAELALILALEQFLFLRHGAEKLQMAFAFSKTMQTVAGPSESPGITDWSYRKGSI